MPTYPYSGDTKGNLVLQQVKGAFHSGKCFVGYERHILFVCGGRTDHDNNRKRFLDYASAAFPKLRVLLAEDAYTDLLADSSEKVINLARFESLLAELADCILIFPESQGSIAELGFFSAFPPLARKTLAVNHLDFQAQDSFISLGPLAAVNAHSNYRPTLHATDDHDRTFTAIAQRLQRLSNVRRREHFHPKEWAQYPLKLKFFILFEITRVLRILHVATLPYVVSELFGGWVNKPEVKRLVSVLYASRLLNRVGDDERYLAPLSDRAFIQLPDDTNLLSASNSYLLKEHADIYSSVNSPGMGA